MRKNIYRGMRNLAVRFVRNSEKLVHVVDPHLDLRTYLREPDVFYKELQARNIKRSDVISLAKNYQTWWNSYDKLSHLEENTPEYRQAKESLLAQDSVLLDVLKLPNRLELKPHFLESTPSHKWAIPDFQIYPSMMKTVDDIENMIFESVDLIRLDPPRFARPAITDAFNLPENEIIRFHEGSNPPMHLVGLNHPGLLVSFVATRFGASNAFPISFLSKGIGYSRKFRGWQRNFVSILILDRHLSSLHSHLNSFRLSFDRSLSALGSNSTIPLEPHQLHLYESAAAITSISSTPVIRYSSTGTYLSKRLKIITDSTEKDIPTFLNIGFIEIDVTSLRDSLKKK